MLKLWCAGKLRGCPPNLHRFHFTCLICRSRRRVIGKWTEPPRWIKYTLYITKFAMVNVKTGEVNIHTKWRALRIDPRGHFTMLRCSIIVTLNKIMQRWRRLEKPLLNFCEFFANYPNF